MMNNSINLKLLNRFYSNSSLKFVPKSKPLSIDDVKKLNEFIISSKKLCVLSGAGVSTEVSNQWLLLLILKTEI
jgi:hypothetical protein